MRGRSRHHGRRRRSPDGGVAPELRRHHGGRALGAGLQTSSASPTSRRPFRGRTACSSIPSTSGAATIASMPLSNCDHTIHGRHRNGWDNSIAPVLSIAPGESIHLECLDSSAPFHAGVDLGRRAGSRLRQDQPGHWPRVRRRGRAGRRAEGDDRPVLPIGLRLDARPPSRTSRRIDLAMNTADRRGSMGSSGMKRIPLHQPRHGRHGTGRAPGCGDPRRPDRRTRAAGPGAHDAERSLRAAAHRGCRPAPRSGRPRTGIIGRQWRARRRRSCRSEPHSTRFQQGSEGHPVSPQTDPYRRTC